MRIVIDMQGAQSESRFRGIGRYTMAFAQGVVRNRGEHEVILTLSGLFPESIEQIRNAFEGLLPQENIRVWQAPDPVRESDPQNNTRRKTAELLREAFLVSLQPDIIHISSLFEGYVDDAITSIGSFDTSTPVSVTLYDLIPLLNPDDYLKCNPLFEQYYLRKVEHLRRASKYLAISNFSRDEGCAALDVAEDKVINVSTAVDSQFKPLTIDEATADHILQKLAITQPFVLYTGGADERKNLLHLIEAYAKLATGLRERHQLVFAGKMPERVVEQLNQQAISHGFKVGELIFTGYVSDQELVKLYNLCQLYVFPSWHEGFGLPALEAMSCGAPVIGAKTSSLPEVIGLDEALFNPFDIWGITEKITQALEDEDFCSRLRAHGLRQAGKFSWEETAKKAVQAWEELHTAQSFQSFIEDNKPIQKPRLAFVSPLPPERTGIADYSAELLPSLAKYYDIELVVAQEKVDESSVNGYGNVHDVAWLYEHADQIERVLYQVGNSPFHSHMLSLLEDIPGTVVLHDFYMSGLMSWLELHGGVSYSWTQAIYESHGFGAVLERFRDMEKAERVYPANWSILKYARGVIVHSEVSRSLAREWFGNSIASDWEVIPLPRLQSSMGAEKQKVRDKLGINQDDFVVCSFGFLDANKLNHRLLQAWLESELVSDKHCLLVFIGENSQGEYGRSLLNTIRENNLGNQVYITGYVTPETYREYLVAADIAVQLRANTRGETSAAVLDCMNHALPTIINANGSMAELDSKAVCMLPEEFSDDELVNALQTLWNDPNLRRLLGDRARTIILDRHAPDKCAKGYAAAIERIQLHSASDESALVTAVAYQKNFVLDQTELLELSQSIATNLPLPKPAKRLFLDITATCRDDLKTGIERVARALVMALIESPPAGYRIEPVYLTTADGAWLHRYARNYTLGLLGCPTDALIDEPLDPQNGDMLLNLDISGDLLVRAEQAGLFEQYRNFGITVYSIVYDLLPIRLPKVFPVGTDENHARWLRAVSTFDGAICISKAVSDDLSSWIDESGFFFNDRRPFKVSWFHLGADLSGSVMSTGMPDDAVKTLKLIRSRISFLMVGTIEPRKGYMQVIAAFNDLWQQGLDVNLIIVGPEGWKGMSDEMRQDIPQTLKNLSDHPELNKRLFWLDGISDEYLEKVYSASTCLIAASYGEGFGLPLIEASQNQLPIIARDIAVFREVAGDYAFYFEGIDSGSLAYAIIEWLKLYKLGIHPDSKNMPKLTWEESAKKLLKMVLE